MVFIIFQKCNDFIQATATYLNTPHNVTFYELYIFN